MSDLSRLRPPEGDKLDRFEDSSEVSPLKVLEDLAAQLGVRTARAKVLLPQKRVLVRRLKADYRDHKIDILAGIDLMLLDVIAVFGDFELMVINERAGRLGLLWKPAYGIHLGSMEHSICTINGELNEHQRKLCESGAIESLLDAIAPLEGEEINIYRRLVRVWLVKPSVTRLLKIIDTIIDVMPHKAGSVSDFESLPEELRPLIPLIRKWGISDDEERTNKLLRSAVSTRTKLVKSVVPLLTAIDQYLDSFDSDPPEDACAVGDLAQAALEAQSQLEEATDASPLRPSSQS